MIALKVEDLKLFTSQLFVGEIFDPFLVREVVITTFNTFTINGNIKKGYYSEEQEQEIPLMSFWKTLKPFCFSLIKGKRLPESFQIQFQLSPQQLAAFLHTSSLGTLAEQIQGLHLAVRYDKGELICVTGVSLNIFTMDKSLEQEWDSWVTKFLKDNKIAFC